MKFFKVSLFVALLVAVSLPAVAQSALQLNIPFNFSAADKTLPAGHYKVERLNESAWCISNRHGSVILLTNRVDSPLREHHPALVFWRSGGTYSLVRFWTTANSGRDVHQTAHVKTTILAEAGEYVEIGAE